jgi:hypothetical protein
MNKMRRATDLIRWLLFGNTVYTWVAAGGAALTTTAANYYWNAYPHWAGFLACLAVLFTVSAAWGLVFVPRTGTCWPPWWVWWYRMPLRKVAWRFGCVLGVSELPARGFVVYEFRCSLKVNRGRITPERLFLESGTGLRVDMKIQAGVEQRPPEDIEYIPAGLWHDCSARILRDATLPDDGRTNHPRREEFFAIYDDLTLIFEYDGKLFRKHFSQRHLKRVIDFTVDAVAPKPIRRAVVKREKAP